MTRSPSVQVPTVTYDYRQDGPLYGWIVYEQRLSTEREMARCDWVTDAIAICRALRQAQEARP